MQKRGALLSETVYANGAQVSHTSYTYDDLMRPIGKTTGSVTETLAYDIRGWQTGHTAYRGQNRIYSETLRYMNPASGSSAARWTGLISESVTQHYGAQARSDSYVYDALGRLTSSNHETSIGYDANGNMTSLRRLSATGSTIANLTLTYSGNRLARIVNTDSEDTGMFSYTYDSSGNLTSDTRNRLEIQNNVLNLPRQVEQGGTMGGTMTYIYLGDGTRAAAKVGADASRYAGKRYRGSFVYDVSAAGVQRLESVAVSTGRLIALTGTNGSVSFESDGFITDHLGNVAAIVNLSASSSTSTTNAILEQNDYTPFGTRLEPALKTQAANRYRYAGKEEQDIAGMDLHLLDFGARYYDSFTCRWNAVDPLAHKYFSISPYAYCGNDPVNCFDPDGRTIYTIDQNGTVVSVANDDTKDLFIVVYSNGEEICRSKTFDANTFTFDGKSGDKINFSTSNVQDGSSAFEFIAQNSNTEIGHVVSSTDGINDNHSTIVSDGFKNHVNVGLIARNLDKKGEIVSYIIHSHPLNTLPSGFNADYAGTQSDKIAKDNLKLISSSPFSMVYLVKSNIYVRFDNSTEENFETYNLDNSGFIRRMNMRYNRK